MRAWCVAVALGVVGGLSCAPQAIFVCSQSSQCISSAGDQGICEATSFCSFPDDTCASGRRYGEFAGNGLGGACVENPDGGAECGRPGHACCPGGVCLDGHDCHEGRCPD